jgi:hypothetical protein
MVSRSRREKTARPWQVFERMEDLDLDLANAIWEKDSSWSYGEKRLCIPRDIEVEDSRNDTRKQSHASTPRRRSCKQARTSSKVANNSTRFLSLVLLDVSLSATQPREFLCRTCLDPLIWKSAYHPDLFRLRSPKSPCEQDAQPRQLPTQGHPVRPQPPIRAIDSSRLLDLSHSDSLHCCAT